MPSLYTKSLDNNMPFMVTLDGASGVGKSSLAKLLSQHFNLHYFGTSLLYRRLAAYILQNNICYEQELSLHVSNLNLNNILSDESLELYTEEIGSVASIIAAYTSVRRALMQYQLDIKQLYPRLILEGRDTGSVIAPEADLKLFITADITLRAERRYNQLRKGGKEVILSAVQKQLQERDARDIGRATAPLVKPEDALVLDNSNVTLDDLIVQIEQYIQRHS